MGVRVEWWRFFGGGKKIVWYVELVRCGVWCCGSVLVGTRMGLFWGEECVAVVMGLSCLWFFGSS